MSSIGDRLGLFKSLAREGPATSVELAERTHVNERYTLEWLRAMTSAGYLEYEPSSHRFTLPADHVPVLAEEGGESFFACVQEEMVGFAGPINQLMEAFRNGGGLSMDSYDPSTWEGQARFAVTWFEHLLVPVWLQLMPEVKAKLESGALVADVGCGQAGALIKLAQTYPRSQFRGYDNFAPALQKAKSNARAAGVSDRVSFEQKDASDGMTEKYDVITTFDVVHDTVDPLGLLRAIHDGLRPDGRYVCVEVNSSDRFEENIGAQGAFLYSCSLLFCLPTSLANLGAGLGTAGLPEATMRKMCHEAGFTTIKRVQMDDSFNALYEIAP
ncbi:MAG TPA: methyltransferase domain-containing protein [Nitrososphaerales archaeon]|nr:methyltransferase domain-containing protein [Nitrososphaerales archaeon]